MYFHSSWSQAVGSQCFEASVGHLLWAPTREHMVWEETETPSRNVLVSNQRGWKESKPTPLQEGTHGPQPVFAMALPHSGKLTIPLRWLLCTSQSRKGWLGGANVTLRVQGCLLAMSLHARLPCLGFPQSGDSPSSALLQSFLWALPGGLYWCPAWGWKLTLHLWFCPKSLLLDSLLLTLPPSRTEQPKVVVSWISKVCLGNWSSLFKQCIRFNFHYF